MRWKTAATLILTTPASKRALEAKKTVAHGRFTSNYDVLMLKRSSKNSFYPNAYVFPGGGFDKADGTSQWLEVFNSVDQHFVKNFESLNLSSSRRVYSPILLPDANHPKDDLPPHISYRICAIRETFEETGLLLARMKPAAESQPNSFQNQKFASIFMFDDQNTLKYWREKVHADANNFLRLCLHFRCVPDIWGLHEWSNWLTPICKVVQPSRRYDTIFYKAALSTLPPDDLAEDNKEISKLVHRPPGELLEDYFARKCAMGNPQVYELLCLVNFSDHHQLVKFFVERGMEGLERYLPLIAVAKDKRFLALYPGDDDYPHGEYQTANDAPIEMTTTTAEMRDELATRKLNRVLTAGETGVVTVICNCHRSYGHINPVQSDLFQLRPSL